MTKTRARRAPVPRLTQVAALIATSSFAALMAAPAMAQNAASTTAEKKDEAKTDGVGLERVVVTATSLARSKMRSSVSVTDLDQDTIKDLGARTEAEVLMLIPGIRTDAAAGPGGNSNISVRGIPVSSGGSKFVQLQEDGLPTVQFGDMNFANNDYWIRFDNNVDSVQTLRGGSASVFASHAPGAVVNYISKTGKSRGGSIGLTRGLNYNETRVDGDYGARLAPDLYFHFGGYYRFGEGVRKTGDNTLDGYQFKGNITKEFNGGKGYVRLNVKLLDEHAPTYPGGAVFGFTQSGNTLGGFKAIKGFDPLRDTWYSKYNDKVTAVDPATGQLKTTSLTDGITVNSKSLGLEFHNELAGGWSVDNKFRKSSNEGSFRVQFGSDVATLSGLLGQFPTGSTARFYNGPNAGQLVTSDKLMTGLIIKSAAVNTELRDMGNVVNDLSVGKAFKLGANTLDFKAGFFHSVQNVKQVWSITERLVEYGRDGAVIDVFGASGAALTTGGLTGYNNQWGGCCAKEVDASFTTDAPYLSLNFGAGPLDIDAGVRRESFKVKGTHAGSTAPAAIDVDRNGTISGAERNVILADQQNPSRADYKVSYTNYSLGANYRVNNDLSVFARTSKGNRGIADRFFPSFAVNGNTGALTADGAKVAAAPVKQHELGVKTRGSIGASKYSVSATVFHTTINEFDYDQTRDPSVGPKLDVLGYKTKGLELEGAVNFGNFRLNANATYVDETKTATLVAANVGKTSAGVPQWRFNLMPSYSIGNLTVGGLVRTNTSVWADGGNTQKIGGHSVVNAFVNYDFGGGITGALNVNNLFDKLAPVGGIDQTIAPGIARASVENGRSINVSLRYAF